MAKGKGAEVLELDNIKFTARISRRQVTSEWMLFLQALNKKEGKYWITALNCVPFSMLDKDNKMTTRIVDSIDLYDRDYPLSNEVKKIIRGWKFVSMDGILFQVTNINGLEVKLL